MSRVSYIYICIGYMRLHSEVKCQCLFTSVKLCLVPNLEKRLKIWKLFLPGMCAAETQFIFNAKILYSAGNTTASFTLYAALIINVSNGCCIITHKSDK